MQQYEQTTITKAVHVSVTLKARAGSSLRVQFRVWNSDHTELVDTSSYTATIQMRASQPPSRVLLSSEEYTDTLPSPAGTVLTRVEAGHWELFLGKTLTSKFPPSVVFELEIVNNENAEDLIPVCTGVIKFEPAEISEIVG